MRVQYDEDRANHIGPEPCTASREGCSEASAGGGAGQPLSLESTNSGADTVLVVEGNTAGGAFAIALSARRGLRHWHALKLLAREPGDLATDHRRYCLLVRDGKVRSRNHR